MWLPPPWVALALVFSISSHISDVVDIASLSLAAIVGRKDSGCDLCHRTVGFILKVSELDEAQAIDCSRLCFGAAQCGEICHRIVDAMGHSERYPCVAAGICPVEDGDSNIVCRFDWKALHCTPTTACVRKFPARCVVNAGIRSWRRQVGLIEKHAGLMASALAQQPRCGSPGAGPYCVVEPTWAGSQACETLSWALPFAFGIVASIRAIETPGGDDDRQWLTFWICFFLFSALERFTSVVLSSRVPLYYELKLLTLCWLIFRHGADTTYRALRKAITHTRRLAPHGPPSISALHAMSTDACGAALAFALGREAPFERTTYYGELPIEVRAEWSLGDGRSRLRSARAFDVWLMEGLATERSIVSRFGARSLVQLRLLWASQAPRFLQIKLAHAYGLPCMAVAHGQPEENEKETADTAPPPPLERPNTPRRTELSPRSVERAANAHAAAAAAAGGRPPPSAPRGAAAILATSLFQAEGSGGTDSYAVLSLVPPPPTSRMTAEEEAKVLSPLALKESSTRRRKQQLVRSQSLAAGGMRARAVSMPAPDGGLREHSEPSPISQVRRNSRNPEYQQSFEFELSDGYLNRDGSFCCPDAPFTSLRIEVWHRVPWAGDNFLGEVTVPLVHLMDMEPHRAWVELTDPQGKANLPPGVKVCGSVYFEAQYSCW